MDMFCSDTMIVQARTLKSITYPKDGVTVFIPVNSMIAVDLFRNIALVNGQDYIDVSSDEFYPYYN